MVPLQGTPGLSIERTRAANGELGDFCEEFFDDVHLPLANLIGEENHGWAVAQTLLFHEHNAIARIGHGYFGRTTARNAVAVTNRGAPGAAGSWSRPSTAATTRLSPTGCPGPHRADGAWSHQRQGHDWYAGGLPQR